MQKRYLRYVLMVLSLSSVFTSVLSSTAHSQTFTIVALPDTQNYGAGSPIPSQQTQWIIDNQLSRNIQLVTQLGDVVDTGNQVDRWMNLSTAMAVLTPLVPYSVIPGNHDYDPPSQGGGAATFFQTYFGEARYSGLTWYLGSAPTGLSFAQKFAGSGFEFLHIGLELRNCLTTADGPAIQAWAQGILDANPSLPAVISTHAYLDVGGRFSLGENLWNEFIRPNPQIFMVLNGHFLETLNPPGDAEYVQVSVNDAGYDVVEMLSNYQQRPNGGDGWLRILEVDLALHEVRVETYSASLNQFEIDSDSQFTIPLDLSQRLAQQGQIVPALQGWVSALLAVILIATGFLAFRGLRKTASDV